ncbi:MAG: type III pantothenate kinase [Fibrobacteres bacterium]|nr:type III pantothenate kinase [Fibrobacterota bacterium]
MSDFNPFQTAFADIGNTRIKLMLPGVLKKKPNLICIPWRNNNTELDNVVHQLKKQGIVKVSAISVNGEGTKKLKRSLLIYGILFLEVNRILCSPLKSDYNIDAIGLDRLANINGARKLFKFKNILVVDSGTALTVEIILGNHHAGGFIIPGERTLAAALHKNTAQLPLLEKIDVSENPGKNTEEAIARGSSLLFRHGAKAFINALCKQHRMNKVVIAGGNGERIKSLISGSVYNPLLTLTGVMFMEKENRCDSSRESQRSKS